MYGKSPVHCNLICGQVADEICWRLSAVQNRMARLASAGFG